MGCLFETSFGLCRLFDETGFGCLRDVDSLFSAWNYENILSINTSDDKCNPACNIQSTLSSQSESYLSLTTAVPDSPERYSSVSEEYDHLAADLLIDPNQELLDALSSPRDSDDESSDGSRLVFRAGGVPERYGNRSIFDDEISALHRLVDRMSRFAFVRSDREIINSAILSGAMGYDLVSSWVRWSKSLDPFTAVDSVCNVSVCGIRADNNLVAPFEITAGIAAPDLFGFPAFDRHDINLNIMCRIISSFDGGVVVQPHLVDSFRSVFEACGVKIPVLSTRVLADFDVYCSFEDGDDFSINLVDLAAFRHSSELFIHSDQFSEGDDVFFYDGNVPVYLRLLQKRYVMVAEKDCVDHPVCTCIFYAHQKLSLYHLAYIATSRFYYSNRLANFPHLIKGHLVLDMCRLRYKFTNVTSCGSDYADHHLWRPRN